MKQVILVLHAYQKLAFCHYTLHTAYAEPVIYDSMAQCAVSHKDIFIGPIVHERQTFPVDPELECEKDS